MGLHPQLARFGFQRHTTPWGASAATPTTTTVTPGATIGVYTTTPVQMVSSTSYDITKMRVWAVAATNNSGARGDLVFDLMAGTSGNETSIIGPLIFGGHSAYSCYTVPIYIPAGTRLSARTAAGVASRSGRTFALEYWGSPAVSSDDLPTRWVAYGVTVASSDGAYGVTLAGSYTAIVDAATTYPHTLWLPMWGANKTTTAAANTSHIKFVIGTVAESSTLETNYSTVNAPSVSGSTLEQIGMYGTTVRSVRGTEHIIHAPRPAGASVAAKEFGTQVGILGAGILAAVK